MFSFSGISFEKLRTIKSHIQNDRSYTEEKTHVSVVSFSGNVTNIKSSSTQSNPILEIIESVNDEKKSSTHKSELNDHPTNDGCPGQDQWQMESYQICNSMHELDLMNGYTRCRGCIHPLGRGGTRDVWMYEEELKGLTKVVLKTLRVDKTFDHKTFKEHEYDAIASEQLTGSPYIIGKSINIYLYM